MKSGTLTRVFAVGDVTKGSMAAVVHSLPVRQTGSGAPSSVQTGNGGQAATSFTDPASGRGREVVPALVAALLSVGVGLRGLGNAGRLPRQLARRSRVPSGRERA